MFSLLKDYLKKRRFSRKWAKQNAHNYTYPTNLTDLNLVSIGKYTYGGIFVLNHGSSNRLYIGSFCSIAPGVSFIVCSDHRYDCLLTYPLKNKLLNSKEEEAVSKGDIVIEDDVWIGMNSIILSGVRVGKGSVVSAGSVVTKDVPPFAIVGGVPAKVIKYRFNQDIIKKLLEIDYEDIEKTFIKDNLESFYKHLDNKDDIEFLTKIKLKK